MRFILWTALLLVLVASLGFLGVVAVYAYYAKELPDYTQLDRRRVFQTARILDRNNELLGEFTDPEGGRRTVVPIDRIPKALRDATIAAEDANFYQHPGFDPIAILRALYLNVRGREIVSGASTITQQLVKNTLLTPEQTPDRKIKEAILAWEVSRRFSKDRILELYLNEVYYGNLAYGVEAAAQTYFGRSVSELDLAELTFIAGLPQAPSGYDPYVNPQAARGRQDYVLEQMVRHGMVTREQADAARAKPIALQPRRESGPIQAPHFVNFIRQLLERSYSSDTLFREGLQIRTSLDLGLQRKAEQAAREQIAELKQRNANNAALVAIKPDSGEILAMVGSVNYDDVSISGQVNVALADRQPGSTLKPFTYLTAFQRGWAPSTMVMDVPTTFGGAYTPLNYDQKFRGPVSVRRALAASLNIPAVKALEFVGMDAMLTTVHRMGVNGLRDPARYGLSVTLGGGEVNLLDLTYAYAPFAYNGRQIGQPLGTGDRTPASRQFEPIAILEIRNGAGTVLYQQQKATPQPVVDAGLAYLITDILGDDEARAETFGLNSPLKLSRPSAAKTGTTDDYRDSWVVGYTPDLVAGVWVGNSDGAPMRDIQSAASAGRIWHAFMEGALEGVPARPFDRPADVVQQEVCKLSGLLPTPECPERVQGLFTPANLPNRPDNLYRRVEVCRVNGKLAFDLVPANARESKVFVVFPAPDSEWGPKNGFPAPPSQRCDDVYRGVQVAKIDGPVTETPVSGTVQVVGSAMLDDFHHLDLEVGAGPNPSVWSKITDGRTEGVDRALLGVWNTASFPSGRYTLRLTVYDSVGNSIQAASPVTVGAAPSSPVPAGSPGPLPPSLMPPLFGPTPAPPAGQPPSLVPPVGGPRPPAPSPAPEGPSGPSGVSGPSAQPTPSNRFAPGPQATPTPTPRRR
ncbi:MAG: PBP1A family penicillin-binding protein [Chloroflexi bacterium]|nr:PBP1A family penicillin-binding protein [Chloroflexota bacterium]